MQYVILHYNVSAFPFLLCCPIVNIHVVIMIEVELSYPRYYHFSQHACIVGNLNIVNVEEVPPTNIEHMLASSSAQAASPAPRRLRKPTQSNWLGGKTRVLIQEKRDQFDAKKYKKDQFKHMISRAVTWMA